jgi:hypothetical protein
MPCAAYMKLKMNSNICKNREAILTKLIPHGEKAVFNTQTLVVAEYVQKRTKKMLLMMKKC